jgi:pyruvate dehydrogenase E1 component beta subunit
MPGMIDLKKLNKKTDEEYFPHVFYPQDYGHFPCDSGLLTISYKDAVKHVMTKLGQDGAVFIGYNVLRGDAMGTLKDVPKEQKLETPVAENLMTGLAIGMSFEGIIPVLYFERHDFMLVAMDAIGNHIDKIERISHGEFKAPVIIRAVAADGGPFYSGPTHSQDFTKVLKTLVNFRVYDPKTGIEFIDAFKSALMHSFNGKPSIIIERKSLY